MILTSVNDAQLSFPAFSLYAFFNQQFIPSNKVVFCFMRFFKLIAFLLFVFLLLCAFSFFTNKNEFGQWEVTSLNKDAAITWARFYWRGDTLSGKYYDKAYMFIPAKLKDLPYTFQFQFDLGDPHTELYEANLLSLCA